MTAVELKPDLWLSEKLGKPAFNLRRGFKEFSLNLLTSSPNFVSAKVPTDEHTAHLHLQQKGFQVIDVSLQYQGKPKLFELSKADYSVRQATNTDETTVCEIASEEFLLNRFHQDPRIPISVAKKIKQDWVANYFRGHRGDVLLVVTFQDEICGFLLLNTQENRFVIDLIAVKNCFRQRGVAKHLISYAWQHHRKSAQEIHVGTQISNKGSMLLYSKMDLKLSATNYLLHLHQ